MRGILKFTSLCHNYWGLPSSYRHTNCGGCNTTLHTRFLMASLQPLQPLG